MEKKVSLEETLKVAKTVQDRRNKISIKLKKQAREVYIPKFVELMETLNFKSVTFELKNNLFVDQPSVEPSEMHGEFLEFYLVKIHSDGTIAEVTNWQWGSNYEERIFEYDRVEDDRNLSFEGTIELLNQLEGRGNKLVNIRNRDIERAESALSSK